MSARMPEGRLARSSVDAKPTRKATPQTARNQNQETDRDISHNPYNSTRLNASSVCRSDSAHSSRGRRGSHGYRRLQRLA